MKRMRVLSWFFWMLVLFLAGCASQRQFNTNSQYAHLVEKSSNPQVHRLYAVLPRYERLAEQAWPTIPYVKAIKPGEEGTFIPAIRHRLMLLGDMTDTGYSESTYYGPQLVQGVEHFQSRHGLDVTGIIGRETIAALNISPRQRLAQLVDSMQRWAKLPSYPGDQYIQVNVPSYELQVIENNDPILSMKVVVGLPNWPTPELRSQVQTIVLNPAWNVPRNITEREIVQHMVKNPRYLEENDLTVYKDWHKDTVIDPAMINWKAYAGKKDLPYLISQNPGDTNALGSVKFIFPNPHDVYLHDTQAKGLFSQSERAFSHGCVRLEEPQLLYQYLMENNPSVDSEKAEEARLSGKTKHVALSKSIPIYITYITAWIDSNGTVQFRKDIYRKLSS